MAIKTERARFQAGINSGYLERDTIDFNPVHAKLGLSSNLVDLPEKARLGLIVVGIGTSQSLKCLHIGAAH
jgi:hypothetical protein